MTEMINPQNETGRKGQSDFSTRKKTEPDPVPQTPVEDLFTVLAHDLRDPVSSIKMLSGFIKDELRNKNHAEVTALFDLLYTQVEHTEHLLNDLLAWGKARTKKIPFQPAHLHLADIFKELVNFYSVRILSKGIVLETHALPEALVYADPNMLNTILRNLLSNAIKFSAQHGKIVLSAHQCDSEVIIRVQDEGRGIPQSILGRLLSDNSIVSTPGTNNENGSGLGLLICKEYMHLHGGSILMESEAGKGTLITLTFPES